MAKRLTSKMKAKWVKALTSGEYEQAEGALRFNGGHCCLGVLCEVEGIRSSGNGYIKDEDGNFNVVREDVQRALAKLNDAHVPFEVIAGLIDEAL